MSKVYLAGPIAGLTDNAARGWRDSVKEALWKHGIIGISPLRCEKPANGKTFDDGPQLDPNFSREILAKNTYDVKNCDVTLAYLPVPGVGQRHSYGTMWEVGATRILNKPVFIVTNDPVIAKHPLFGGVADWVYDDMDKAVERIIAFLETH
jgi:nucleoside 2-deoxyribosyltransferase